MKHRDLCILATHWLIQQKWCDLAAWEIQYSSRRSQGIVDSIGLTSSPRVSNPRITAIEVKRTRGDLLADLRAQKLLKYENKTTHCYLAATPAALGNKLNKQILLDLKAKGLPTHWGVLVLKNNKFICLRAACRHNHVTAAQKNYLVRKIARSYCYRLLSKSLKNRLLNQEELN